MSSNVISTQVYRSPAGELLLGSIDGFLVLADWRYRAMRNRIDMRIKSAFSAEYAEGEDDVLSETMKQFGEYFSGIRKDFDIPLKPAGSEFQLEVWRALRQIPYGQTASYADLATTLGNPDSVRAVAAANGANAISIIIPCHRIIGSDGSLVGYAGGTAAKEKLLELEGSMVSQGMLF